MKHYQKVDSMMALERAKVRLSTVIDRTDRQDHQTRSDLLRASSDIEDVRNCLHKEVRDVRPKR